MLLALLSLLLARACSLPLEKTSRAGLVIDRFEKPDKNALGFYHGGELTISPENSLAVSMAQVDGT